LLASSRIARHQRDGSSVDPSIVCDGKAIQPPAALSMAVRNRATLATRIGQAAGCVM